MPTTRSRSQIEDVEELPYTEELSTQVDEVILIETRPPPPPQQQQQQQDELEAITEETVEQVAKESVEETQTAETIAIAEGQTEEPPTEENESSPEQQQQQPQLKDEQTAEDDKDSDDDNDDENPTNPPKQSSEEVKEPEKEQEEEQDNLDNDDDDDAQVPNDEALEILADVIEYQVEKAFGNRERRLHHFETMEYFWKQHPMRNCQFGRLYTLVHLLTLLVGSCTTMPYANTNDDETDDEEDEGNDGEIDVEAMVNWSRRLWEELEENLKEAFDLCRRADVRHVFRFKLEPQAIAKLEQREIVDNNPIFSERFHRLRKLLGVHKTLAPIRSELERAIAAGEDPQVSQDELDEILFFLREEESHPEPENRLFPGVKDRILDLFEIKAADDNERRLKDYEELKVILEHARFDLEKFQQMIEVTLQKWKTAILGREATLYHLGYRAPEALKLQISPQSSKRGPTTPRHKSSSRKPSSSTRRSPTRSQLDELQKGRKSSSRNPRSNSKRSPTRSQLDELRKGRAALKKGHGDDPLEESRVIAQKVVNKKRPRDEDDKGDDSRSPNLLESSAKKRKKSRRGESLYEPKESSVQLTFDDSDDDVSKDGSEDRVRLGSTPSKRKSVSPFPKTYRGVMPDPGVFDQNGKVLRRRPWTQEEKTAIRQGVRRYGKGKWIQIKEEYDLILRNRTAVQCKDCYRTMERKGEIHDSSSEEEEDDDEDESDNMDV